MCANGAFLTALDAREKRIPCEQRLQVLTALDAREKRARCVQRLQGLTALDAREKQFRFSSRQNHGTGLLGLG